MASGLEGYFALPVGTAEVGGTALTAAEAVDVDTLDGTGFGAIDEAVPYAAIAVRTLPCDEDVVVASSVEHPCAAPTAMPSASASASRRGRIAPPSPKDAPQ